MRIKLKCFLESLPKRDNSGEFLRHDKNRNANLRKNYGNSKEEKPVTTDNQVVTGLILCA